MHLALVRPVRGHGIYSVLSGRKHRSYTLTCISPMRPSASARHALKNLIDHTSQTRRAFGVTLPTVLVPPVVFASLFIGLWTYKCIMTVLFQDKIIYMPYMPPYARKERVEDYAAVCKPVQWQHLHIRSSDGKKLALCVGCLKSPRGQHVHNRRRKIVICYFQGNGSSTPPRLPLLSNTLKAIDDRASLHKQYGELEFIVVALSYRGYWTSNGRASQKGIELDARAMLDWVDVTQAQPVRDAQIILWGQSIGAGIATTAAASWLSANTSGARVRISGLILETPFTGIKSMLLALYPQKWLPYRYLWPFLWNFWDSEAALRNISRASSTPRVLIMPATRDEVVPAGEADKLEHIAQSAGLTTQRVNIIGALHTEATTRKEGQAAIADFVLGVANEHRK